MPVHLLWIGINILAGENGAYGKMPQACKCAKKGFPSNIRGFLAGKLLDELKIRPTDIARAYRECGGTDAQRRDNLAKNLSSMERLRISEVNEIVSAAEEISKNPKKYGVLPEERRNQDFTAPSL